MIIAAGTLSFDPSKVDDVQEALTELMAETRQEDGCLSYTFTSSFETPGEFSVFEQWESEEAMNLHMTAPALTAFLGKVADLGITGSSIDRHDVSSSSKLM